MNAPASFSVCASMIIWVLGCYALQAAPAKPATLSPSTNAAPAALQVPQSVFIVPTSPKEGRDPFFPDSTAVYGRSDVKAKTGPVTTALVLNGLSGATTRRLAIINGRTLAEGEESEVNTAAGRVQIRCVEIRDKSVVVEVGGVRQELHLRPD